MLSVLRLALVMGLLGSLLAMSAEAATERRVALVIGNSSYRNAPPLQNTVNDAQDMAASLRKVGFEVVDGSDLDKRGMDLALTRFARLAQDADAALFYFAGHGLQFNGQNYLVPVEARLEDEVSLQYEMTRLNDVLTALSYAKGVKILVLDACRNNPFVGQLARNNATRSVSVDRGLAPIPRAQGMVIAYATQANDVAADGVGRNSPFTAALVEEITQPGLEVAALFRRVQKRVYDATGGKQTPELSLSLLGDFYINRSETDADVWRRVRAGDDVEAHRDFLRRFPASFFAPDARTRLELIERQASAGSEREKLAREFAEREKALMQQLERAQQGRQQAATELAVRPTAPTRPPESPPATAAPTPTLSIAPLAPAAELTERERLARELARREQEIAALEAEKRSLAQERQARERAMAERIGGVIEMPAVEPPQAPTLTITRPQAAAPPSGSGVRVGADAPAPPASRQGVPRTRAERDKACNDALERAQLGDLSGAAGGATCR